MKPNLLIKVATLTAFAVLMSGFVAYKAGAFENYLTEKEPGSLDSPVKDTAEVKPRMMAPGSKSGVIFETAEEPSKKDSPVRQTNNPVQQEQTTPKTHDSPKIPIYMGSSKSAPVFTPSSDTSQPK